MRSSTWKEVDPPTFGEVPESFGLEIIKPEIER